jgi:chemotaxis response regulator CheB
MPLSSLPSTLCMRSRRVGAEGKQGREHEDQLFREEMEMHVRELVLANGGNDLSVLGDAAHKDVGTESVGTQAQIHCMRQAERSLECARNPQEQRWLEGGGYRGRGVLPKSPSCSPLLPSSSPPRSLAIIGAGAGGTALIAALARLLPKSGTCSAALDSHLRPDSGTGNLAPPTAPDMPTPVEGRRRV